VANAEISEEEAVDTEIDEEAEVSAEEKDVVVEERAATADETEEAEAVGMVVAATDVVSEVTALAKDMATVAGSNEAATNGKIAATSSGVQGLVQIRVKSHPEFPGIYQVVLEDGAKRLATRNFAPGRNVYGERLLRFEGAEYRVWDAFRSKLAGAILKGLKTVPILPGNRVLYLGAASGTTPSHISDIVGEEGHVYCVEFAQRSLRDLVTNVVAHRSNMSPFLSDARMPQKYGLFIPGKLDEIYCDIAQPEQAKVLADNADIFLKEGGWILLAVKSQSIDVTLPPSEVYQMEAKILRNRGFQVEQIVDLEPYDIAHAMIVAQR
jgi:fibrillarin-like pre-rRNA processing protein